MAIQEKDSLQSVAMACNIVAANSGGKSNHTADLMQLYSKSMQCARLAWLDGLTQ